MKILCVCDEGNNRSVNLANRLKYWGNDCIPIGLETTSNETLAMLYNWADFIICTAKTQTIPKEYIDKYRLCDIGVDNYPRPFNQELDKKIKVYLEKNKKQFYNIK